MKRVIRFTKARFVMISLSVLLMIAGIVGTYMRGGFNLGIDFQAGLNQRVQIAPLAFRINYTGEGDVRVNLGSGQLTLSVVTGEGPAEHVFPFTAYSTTGALISAVNGVEGFTAAASAGSAVSSLDLLGFSFVQDMTADGVAVNYIDRQASPLEVEQVRSVLAELGSLQIQIVGDRINQEFNIRIQDPGEDRDFSTNASARITSLLEGRYGKDQVIVKQSDYVGARYSGELVNSVFSMVLLTLLLILVYIWFRFKLGYAVASVLGLLHDVILMAGFIGVTQMEVVSATIAAILTMIGYSLNDTIVIFDRIRENRTIMKDSNFQTIVDTSITQSLSRTLITSLTTFLAVLALYIFSTGSIRDFALVFIVGIVIGTYSSMFIAAPILLGWTNRRRRKKGKSAPEKPQPKKLEEPEKPEKSADKPEQDRAVQAAVTEIPALERKLKKKKKKK